MANKKKATPAKRKYTKKAAHWVKENPEIVEPDNQELLQFVLDGVSRLTLKDKAQVFAHILGKDKLDENQMWAVQKILS